ncbi:sulfotransferase [Acidisoma cellulosilytica]|uniref:Sulfotransferase n=1 Tax=Acidisoma cellulosilyticum TaxID=2802395 RepID=A0A964E5M5_9PROT|nr:sulfotransferase [Acidisoma cellulosilyticum]
MHFISGLPRSGSTLLSAVLLQNPIIHAGITSPLGSMTNAMMREMGQGNETAVFIDDRQREAVLRGLFDNYYEAIHPRQTVIDTNRLWCTKLHMIAGLFPQAKVICCVRNIAWIIDSVERLVRANRWELSKIFDFDTAGSVYSRAEGLASRSGMVGYAYNAVKEAMHSDESDRLLLLRYETLTEDPGAAIGAVYDFLGLEPFLHDFDNIFFETQEFDARLGTPGLHTVGRTVRRNERTTVLPPDLWNRYSGDSVWLDPVFNTRGVRII